MGQLTDGYMEEPELEVKRNACVLDLLQSTHQKGNELFHV